MVPLETLPVGRLRFAAPPAAPGPCPRAVKARPFTHQAKSSALTRQINSGIRAEALTRNLKQANKPASGHEKFVGSSSESRVFARRAVLDARKRRGMRRGMAETVKRNPSVAPSVA